MRQWRRRKKALGVFSKNAKRCKSVNISENNNTNKIFFYILTNFTIWDGLSQKTISRYCPFKGTGSRYKLQILDPLYWFQNLQNAPLMRCRHCHFPRGLGENIWEKKKNNNLLERQLLNFFAISSLPICPTNLCLNRCFLHLVMMCIRKIITPRIHER